jgi:glucose-6-phosphate 1-dehydrogenase
VTEAGPIRISDTQVLQAAPRHLAHPADPCAMVIFGASGDLTKRLLVPALYNLARTKVLPENFALIGVARANETAESWRAHLRDMLKTSIGGEIDEAAWNRLAAAMSYVPGDVADAGFYDKLRDALDEAASRHGTRGNAIFYLAVADRFFGTIIEQLGKAKLTEEGEGGDGKRY